MGKTVSESTVQAFVVMKNEVLKFVHSKRMALYLGLVLLILAIMTFAPYIIGDGLPDTPGGISSMYLSLVSLIVLMSSTLFASISIVSEYEERTALIVFTRPIRKISIYVGKVLASLLVSWAFIILYYAVTAVVSSVVAGGIDPDLLTSLVLAFGYSFGTTGVALLVSSIMKKSNTSTILTFVILLAILPAISTVMTVSGTDASFMLDQAGGTIASASESYRDSMNAALDGLAAALSNPANFINPDALMAALAGTGISPEQFIAILSSPGVWFASSMDVSSMYMQAPDVAYSLGVMLAWGIACMVIALIKFNRREF